MCGGGGGGGGSYLKLNEAICQRFFKYSST